MEYRVTLDLTMGSVHGRLGVKLPTPTTKHWGMRMLCFVPAKMDGMVPTANSRNAQDLGRFCSRKIKMGYVATVVETVTASTVTELSYPVVAMMMDLAHAIRTITMVQKTSASSNTAKTMMDRSQIVVARHGDGVMTKKAPAFAKRCGMGPVAS
jgi:3-deoxy-D-manno-octulosonic acid (KDO) 8-phosphate synthase